MTTAPPLRLRVALASCAELLRADAPSSHAVTAADDSVLHAALSRLAGVEHALVDWADGAVDWHHFHLVVIRTTWDYSESEARKEHFLRWAARLESAGVPLAAPSRVLAFNADKSVYLPALAAAGVATVPTLWLAAGSAPPADLAAAAAARGWPARGLVVKPCVSAGSRATRRWLPAEGASALAELQAFLVSALADGGMMVQPYLPVDERGELSVVVVAGEPRHALRKRPRQGDFRVQEEFGGVNTALPLSEAQAVLARSVLAAAARAGAGDYASQPLAARVDFLEAESGELLLLELELIEPCLFLAHQGSAGTADALARAIVARAAASAAAAAAAVPPPP